MDLKQTYEWFWIVLLTPKATICIAVSLMTTVQKALGGVFINHFGDGAAKLSDVNTAGKSSPKTND